ncbi:MAG TPA: VanZ family protein [Chitinophagales bacterium]|nr:VanZ family protein [Chitinophagales bacterium]
MKDFLKYNWPAFLWALLILYLCLVPSRHLPVIAIPNFDKLVHATFYFTLVVLMNFGWRKQSVFQSLKSNTLLKIFVIACVYGFSIELMQKAFTTDRHFELLDELANATGAAIGTLLAVNIFK